MVSPMMASKFGLLPATSCTRSIPRAERSCAQSMSLRMRERPSTAGTCFRSPMTASRRSIRKPAACSQRSRRPAAAARGSRGPKGRCGLGNIGTGRSIRSIPRPGIFFAPSSPIVSSQESLGSMESSGMPPGKVRRAICGESIRKRVKSWRHSTCRPA